MPTLEMSCFVQESRPGKFMTGDKLTHGDLAVFCQLSVLQSGWLDGESHWARAAVWMGRGGSGR